MISDAAHSVCQRRNGGLITVWVSVRRRRERARVRQRAQPARTFARFSKKDLDGQGSQAQGDIVMVFVRQYSAAAERTASCATLANRGRLFGGSHNDDPSKGSRTIKTPMSQILEPVSWGVDTCLGGPR
jgi:hypothetical protein